MYKKQFTREFIKDRDWDIFGNVIEIEVKDMDKLLEKRIEELETENELLKKEIRYLKANRDYLRTRCMESARDSFDEGNYGALIIVKGLSPSELLMHMSDGIGHTETLKKFGIEIDFSKFEDDGR